MNNDKQIIEIYTDGACSNNQNREVSVGGWAYRLFYMGHEKIGKGQVKNTTNIRMEMTLLLHLNQLKNRYKRIYPY